MANPEDIAFAADDVIVYLAAAGAGKTSALMNEMTELFKTYRPDEIAFVTFTRKGVANGKERALQTNPQLTLDDLIHFKTLHALCFRELGLKRVSIIERADIAKFSKKGDFNVTLSEAFEQQTDDDKLLSRYDAARNGSTKGIYVHGKYDEGRYNQLIKAYENFKAENHLVDFHDCLLKFRERNMPVNVKVAFIDEAQDLTLLQWEVCQIAFSAAEKIRIAGDDYQCQPSGSLVLTKRGYAAIEELTNEDSVIAWDRNGGMFHGFRNRRYAVKRGWHVFDGYLVDVRHDDKVTRFTPNHKMIVRWGKRDTSLRCVYLMRQGRNYRVGQCQIFNKSGITNLALRMRQEQADGLWILYVSYDKTDILVKEQLISLQYGLPQLCFTYRKEVSSRVFDFCDTYIAARRCLEYFQLDIRLPLLTDSRIRSQSRGTSIFTCEAVNLRPEIMLLPKLGDDYRKTLWAPFTVGRSEYAGPVYGLDVEQYHTYVTDGIVTHNSLFTYAGASPSTLISLAQRYRTAKLETSYRLPKAVYRFAKGIVQLIEDKIDKDFAPAKDFEGVLEEVDRNLLMRRIRKDITDNGLIPYRWYLLFRNNCFIGEVTALLEQYAIPYHTPDGFCIPAQELARIKRFYNFRKQGYGSKDAFEKFCKDHSIQDINADFTESGLIPGEKRYAYLDYVAQFGVEALTEMANKEPFLLLSTTHRVKGGEADFVAVFFDCTRSVAENMLFNMDEELRVLYVACTRAKIGLFLVASKGKYSLSKIAEGAKDCAL
jgi:superfamily I DNA/RNA helicase